MNKVILMGRLTRDPELRYTPSGVANATFTLAVNRRFKKEGQPEADFINCVVWQKPAENVANMIGKGCRIEVVGRWNTRNYEGQDGKRVYVNECVVEESTFIDFKDGGERQNGTNNSRNNQSNTNAPHGNQNANREQNDPFNSNGQIDIDDSDLPF